MSRKLTQRELILIRKTRKVDIRKTVKPYGYTVYHSVDFDLHADRLYTKESILEKDLKRLRKLGYFARRFDYIKGNIKGWLIYKREKDKKEKPERKEIMKRLPKFKIIDGIRCKLLKVEYGSDAKQFADEDVHHFKNVAQYYKVKAIKINNYPTYGIYGKKQK